MNNLDPKSNPMKQKYILDSVFADNGEHSHFVLIESATGIKVWSEDPEECKAQGYPVKDQTPKPETV